MLIKKKKVKNVVKIDNIYWLVVDDICLLLTYVYFNNLKF